MPGKPEQTGKRKPRPPRSRRSLIVSSLLLAAILFLVIAFITFRQLRAAETNRMRLLAGFAGQVEATVLDLVQRYVNVVDQVPRAFLAGGAGAAGVPVTPEIKESLEDVPNVSLVAGPLPTEATERRFELDARGPRVYLRYDTALDEVFPLDVESTSVLPSEPAEPSGAPPDEEAAQEDSAEAARLSPGMAMRQFTGLLDLPEIVRPMVIPEAFDLVVLARRGAPPAGGDTPPAAQPFTVLFQQGTGELKLADARAAWEVRTPGIWQSLKAAWSEDADPEPTGGGTRVVEARIAGTDYRVFVQPVTLHLRDTEGNPLGPPQEWIACGLISWENLLSSSFTTSPAILFLMVALIPLMLVAWPFLKLALITRRQPFTRFDAAFLVLSTLVGLALATLLILDGIFLSRIEATVDGQLEPLGEGLDRHLHAELDDAAAVLRAVRDDSSTWRGHAPTLFDAMRSSSPEESRDPLPDDLQAETRSTFSYPFLHAVFWADRDGEQMEKIPFHRDSVLRNRVNERGYFRCPRASGAPTLLAREGLTAVLAPAGGSRPDPPPEETERCGDHRICLQSVRSKTTAGDLAVLSMAACESRGEQEEGGQESEGQEERSEPAPEAEVVALTTRLVSLNRALLAPGFSFAVVDRNGAVAFHSDPRRNVNEDFLKATGDDPVLAALLAERREGPVDLHYWGGRYRARVLPLDRLPWSLITLRTTQDLRIRNFELVYDVLNPFLLYGTLLGLALFLGIWHLPGNSLRRLLPSRAFTPVYRQIVLWSPVAVGLFALLLATDRPLVILFATVVPQAVLLAAAVYGFAAPDPWPPAAEKRKEMVVGGRRLWSPSIFREPDAGERWILAGGLAAVLLAVAITGFDHTVRLLLAAVLVSIGAFFLLYRAFADRTTEAPYSAALAVTLVAFAVLPALGFFRLAESRQTQLLVQDTQVGLLRHWHLREASLLGDRGDLWRQLGEDGAPGAGTGSSPADDWVRRFAAETGQSFFGAVLTHRSEDEGEAVGSVETPSGCPDVDGQRPPPWPYGREPESSRPLSLRGVARLLSSRPFPLNDLTAQPLGTDLSRFRHHGVCWSLAPSSASGTPQLPQAVAGGEPTSWLRAVWNEGLDVTPDARERVESAWVPFGGRLLVGDLPPLRSTLSVLVFLGLGLLVVGSSAFLSRRIALIELAPNRKHAAIDKLLNQVCFNGRRAQRFLVRTSLPAAVEQMARGPAFRERVHVLEFGKLWSGDVKEREAAFFGPLNQEIRPSKRRLRGGLSTGFKPRALLVTDFRPDLSDLEETDAKVDLLLRLERHGLPKDAEEWRGRSVLIVTSRPYHLLARPGTDGDASDAAEARGRWHAYFARFGQRHARDEGKIEMFESWIAWQRAWLAAGHWPPPRPANPGEENGPRGSLEPDWFWKADGQVWIDRGDSGSAPKRQQEERVLEGCEGVFTEPPEKQTADWRKRRLHRLLGVVLEECRWTWRLQRVGIDILRELQEGLRQDLEPREHAGACDLPPERSRSEGAPDPQESAHAQSRWEPPTRNQLINRIGLAAQPYYERVWDGCEVEEKRVLWQLARHGVVNPKAFDTVLDLLNKGLVVRTSDDPTLRLMNRSFALFVRRTVRRSEVWRWEEEEGLSAWEIWKWVLPIPLLLLGAFLFMTQQDALSNVVGLVVALASLVPTGVNLYQHFQHLAAEREATA